MLKAFSTMLKGALRFTGRTSRRYHNLALLASWIIFIVVLGFVSLINEKAIKDDAFKVVAYIFDAVFYIIFIFPMRVRRLHDCNSYAPLYLGCHIFAIVSLIPITIFYVLDIETATTVTAVLIGISGMIVVVYNLFAIFVASVSDGAKHGSYLGNDFGYFPESSQDDEEKYTSQFSVTKIESAHTINTVPSASDVVENNIEYNEAKALRNDNLHELENAESTSHMANSTDQLFDETDIFCLSNEIQYGLIRQNYSGKDIGYLVKEIKNDYKAAKKRQKRMMVLQLGIFCVGGLLSTIVQDEINDELWRVVAIVLSGVVMFAPILISYFCEFGNEVQRLRDYYYIITKIQYEQNKKK